MNLQLTHGGETTLLTRLVDDTQVAVDPLKVHYALDTKGPGTVFCGIFAGATKPDMSCCSRGGEWGYRLGGGAVGCG